MSETIPDTKLKSGIEEWVLGQALSVFLESLSAPANSFHETLLVRLSIRELSNQYGIPESNIKTQLYRTRESLKKYLKKEGVYYE